MPQFIVFSKLIGNLIPLGRVLRGVEVRGLGRGGVWSVHSSSSFLADDPHFAAVNPKVAQTLAK